MPVEKLRKLVFGGNIGAIGFISGIAFNMALNGNLNLINGMIFLVLIIVNVICAKNQW